MNPGVPTLVLFAPPRVLNPPLAAPPGGEKFTLLKMLKNSDRNWRDFVSVNLKLLKRAKSKFSNLGPRSVLRPRVPYVKGWGTVKAAGLYQACGLCLNPAGRSATPGTGSPRCVSLEGLMLALSKLTLTVNGWPLSSVAIPLTCQPPMSRSPR